MEHWENRYILALAPSHHQIWQFSRYSYLEQPRTYHGILLLLSGKMEYVSDHSHLKLKPGDLVYLPKDSHYEAEFHPGTEDLLINFRILEGHTEAFPAAPTCILKDGHRTLQPLMEQTIALSQSGPEQYPEAMSLFYRFCQQLSAALQTEDRDQALLRRAKLLLSQADCPSLEAVAKQLLLSPSGLRKKFKDAEGISPSQFRLEQKVENAKQQLLSTDLPLSQISDRCGFCDAAYFHKIFCRKTGLTPTAYRRSHRLL